jgi:hypothetical protein
LHADCMLIASLIRYVKLRGLEGAAERNGQVCSLASFRELSSGG